MVSKEEVVNKMHILYRYYNLYNLVMEILTCLEMKQERGPTSVNSPTCPNSKVHTMYLVNITQYNTSVISTQFNQGL